MKVFYKPDIKTNKYLNAGTLYLNFIHVKRGGLKIFALKSMNEFRLIIIVLVYNYTLICSLGLCTNFTFSVLKIQGFSELHCMLTGVQT